MSNVLLYGDIHAGHKNIAVYRNQFRDEQDHFEHVEIEYHKRVTKRDKCIFTGDTVFTKERLAQISKWRGQKVLILGNHDTDNLTIQELSGAFDKIYSLLKYKEFWLSHAPIHPNELRGKINIHGHVHNATIKDQNYFNTSLENTDFKPISLFEIRTIIQKRKQYKAEYGFCNVPDMRFLQ